MSDQGDLHNFGQCVKSVERASGSYFQKPRPVYWEWLFFGKDSPLKRYFSESSTGNISPGSCLFNLEVEIGEDYCGFSRRVVPSDEPPTAGHAYSLGVLLAYCYVFGIRDLHRHNVIKTASHLQVVDAEVVLVKLLLPNETLLLPFKDVGPDLAAISHLGADSSALSSETITEIFRGYCDTFTNAIKNLAEIMEEFSSRSDEISRMPVRHIARDTVHYRNWKTITPKTPFFSDEQEQLDRGDIPYFFKFIGDERLYKYINKENRYSQVAVPDDFEKAVKRDAFSPIELLRPDRVQANLLPTGILFLAKILLGSVSKFELSVADVKLKIEENRIATTVGNLVYQTAK